MKTLLIVLVGMFVACPLIAPTLLCAAGDDLPVEGETPAAPGAYIWYMYKCKSAACPADYLRDGSENYYGCISSEPGCGGECYSCAGSTTIGKLCRPDVTDTCVWPNPALGSLGCGLKSKHQCTTTRPGGFVGTAPPNGCYCVGAGTALGLTCNIAQCIPAEGP